MKHLFVPYKLALLAKEKGFNEKTIAFYSELQYPINNSGNDFKTTYCLFIDCEMSHNEVKMLWVDNEDAYFHWCEGTYQQGEHSTCKLTGYDLAAPLYQQLVDWFREEHKILVECTPVYDWNNWTIKLTTEDLMAPLHEIPWNGIEYNSYYDGLTAALTTSFKLI